MPLEPSIFILIQKNGIAIDLWIRKSRQDAINKLAEEVAKLTAKKENIQKAVADGYVSFVEGNNYDFFFAAIGTVQD